jgi:lysozyme
MSKQLNDEGVLLIAGFEGLSLEPYYATADEKAKGIVTIGFGNTYYPDGSKVKITDAPITKLKAVEILHHTASNFSTKVANLITSNVNQNQFNSLVSFAYNVGLGNFQKSTLLRLVNNNPNDANIAKEFLKWNKQKGKELAGLTNRRIEESKTYFTNP